MPNDIFISYSSKDRAQAEQLTELLMSAGLSVWIDKSSIEIASSWSEEIVDAIDSCKAFIVMLSPSSIQSPNVVKEVSLASEKRKKILPLDLEPVELPKNLQYALAGIQRAPMTNIDAVIRALGKLGLEATAAPQAPKIVKEADGRKSLMILPFEDLSPTGDNQWFADGIVSELISALSNVHALRVTDAATTREYRSFKGQLTTYAREMAIRYFVQGDVRKFGDSIKISVRLLDIETGDHLWQDALKGEMKDIFDIQEQVARRVVEGLTVRLSNDEEKKLAERGTTNEEAWECYVRAEELWDLFTKNAFEQGIVLLDRAIELDPKFARAYRQRASNLSQLYFYEKNSEHLVQAKANARRAFELDPSLHDVHLVLSAIYLDENNPEAARAECEAYLQKEDSADAHGAMGYYYYRQRKFAEALKEYEIDNERRPNKPFTHWNAALIAHEAGDNAACLKWSEQAIPIFQKRLRLHPDDQNIRQELAHVLLWSGRRDESLEELGKLEAQSEVDPSIRYQMAHTYKELGAFDKAVAALKHAQAGGYELTVKGLNRRFEPLRGHPAFEALRKELEEKRNA